MVRWYNFTQINRLFEKLTNFWFFTSDQTETTVTNHYCIKIKEKRRSQPWIIKWQFVLYPFGTDT